MKSFLEITGSGQLDFRWGHLFLILRKKPNMLTVLPLERAKTPKHLLTPLTRALVILVHVLYDWVMQVLQD